MRYILASAFLFLTSLCVGQEKIRSEKVVDISGHFKSLAFMMAKSDAKIINPSLVKHRGYIYLSYMEEGIADSINVLRFTRSRELQHKTVNIEPKFDITEGAGAVMLADKGRKYIDNLFIITEREPLKMVISGDRGKSWSYPVTINGYGGDGICGTLTEQGGGIAIYFHDNGKYLNIDTTRVKSMIFKISSTDNGNTWSLPSIAIKHNLYSIKDPDIDIWRKNRKEQTFLMVTKQESSEKAFISLSVNHGHDWYHPKELPESLNGSNHKIMVLGSEVYILYTQADSLGHKNLLLWNGSASDLIKKNKGNYIMKIVDSKDEYVKIDDAMIIPFNNRKFLVSILGEWEKDIPAYIKGVIVKRNKIKKGFNKILTTHNSK